MNFPQFTSLAMVVVAGFSLCGCSLNVPNPAAKASQPLAPLISEPVLVRVHAGKVALAQGAANVFSAQEELTPDEGHRFIAVGLRIGPKQTLAIDDYELLDDPADPQIPFAVAGEGPEAPQSFYDTEDFSESVELSKGTREVTTVEGQGAEGEALVVGWETASPTLLLIYEIPKSMKKVTFRHGSRTFELEPDTGLINGKPGAAK
jgi:hypothetical protein